MPSNLECLLNELEEASAQALALVESGELALAADIVRRRGVTLSHLQEALTVVDPVSYEEWNRLAVIHFQGNRVQEALTIARARLAAELIDNFREQSLLDSMSHLVSTRSAPSVQEIA
jgi:hypothetical protein